MSSPSSSTSPASDAEGTSSCIRLRMRRNVDLPQPDGPISDVICPGGMSSDTLSSTLWSPNQAEMLRATRPARSVDAAGASVLPVEAAGQVVVGLAGVRRRPAGAPVRSGRKPSGRCSLVGPHFAVWAVVPPGAGHSHQVGQQSGDLVGDQQAAQQEHRHEHHPGLRPAEAPQRPHAGHLGQQRGTGRRTPAPTPCRSRWPVPCPRG